VDPGRREIARLAVEVLLEAIAAGENRAPRRELRSEFRILQRESTTL
jgi:DNA-binding LacI/PurR family transcriptional regulator